MPEKTKKKKTNALLTHCAQLLAVKFNDKLFIVNAAEVWSSSSSSSSSSVDVRCCHNQARGVCTQGARKLMSAYKDIMGLDAQEVGTQRNVHLSFGENFSENKPKTTQIKVLSKEFEAWKLLEFQLFVPLGDLLQHFDRLQSGIDVVEDQLRLRCARTCVPIAFFSFGQACTRTHTHTHTHTRAHIHETDITRVRNAAKRLRRPSRIQTASSSRSSSS